MFKRVERVTVTWHSLQGFNPQIVVAEQDDYRARFSEACVKLACGREAILELALWQPFSSALADHINIALNTLVFEGVIEGFSFKWDVPPTALYAIRFAGTRPRVSCEEVVVVFVRVMSKLNRGHFPLGVPAPFVSRETVFVDTRTGDEIPYGVHLARKLYPKRS